MRDSGREGGPGAALRALRVAHGASIEDLARATRIGTGYLEALEAERVADLPAPVFVKGFIRACCEHLGEPSAELVQRYRPLLGESGPERPAARPAEARSPLLGPATISLILVIVLGLSLLALTQLTRDARETGPTSRVDPAPAEAVPLPASPEPRATPAAAPSPSPAEPTAPAGPAASLAPAAPAAPTAPPAEREALYRLAVKAVETTWIRVQSDGQVVSELLTPGAVREWASQSGFVLTVGNAAGIRLTLNDRAMPPLGERGVVIRRLEIPPRPDSAR